MSDTEPKTEKNGNQKRQRPKRSLPTDRIAFDKQLDILRAAAALSGHGGRPVSNSEIAEVVKLTASTISLSNPFFNDIGLLEKVDGGKSVPHEAVRSFKLAWDWDAETAAMKLGPVVEGAWFGTALLPKLDFGPMTKKEALTVLAEAIDAGPDYESRLVLLLDYLEATGAIELDGDTVRRLSKQSAPRQAGQDEGDTDDRSARKKEPSGKRGGGAVATAFNQPTEGTVQFHISVKVDMTEMAEWRADRITAFFGGIAQVLAAKGEIEEGASKNH